MNRNNPRSTVLATAVAGLIASGFATAEGEESRTTTDRQTTQQTDRDRRDMGNETDTARTADNETQRNAMDGQEQVNEALDVVNRMKRDPQLTTLLERAQGVYIVPDFGKAALGIGGRGGKA